MKRLLSILSSFIIVGSTAISVVSCDNNKVKTYQDRWHDEIPCNGTIYDITTWEEGAKPAYKTQYLFCYIGNVDWIKYGPSGYLYEGIWKGNYIDTFFNPYKYSYSFYGNMNLPHGAKNPSSEKYKATN